MVGDWRADRRRPPGLPQGRSALDRRRQPERRRGRRGLPAPASSTCRPTSSFRAGRRRTPRPTSRSPMTDYGRGRPRPSASSSAVCPSAVMVRTSLIYGTVTLSAIAARRRATRSTAGRRRQFFTDELRCPVHVEDIAAAVTRLAAMPRRSPVPCTSPDPKRSAEPSSRMRTARWSRPRPVAGPHRDTRSVGPRPPRPRRARLEQSHGPRHPLSTRLRGLSPVLGRVVQR